MVAVVGAIAIVRLMTRPCLTGVSAGTSWLTTVSGVLVDSTGDVLTCSLAALRSVVASAFVLPTTSGHQHVARWRRRA